MNVNEKEFYRLRDFMYQKFGINLSAKKMLIEGRLSNTLSAKGFKSFTEFIDHLESDKTGEALSLVVTKLTTNFTYFYREEQHFEYMKKVALPEILPTMALVIDAGCWVMVMKEAGGAAPKAFSAGRFPSEISHTLVSQFRPEVPHVAVVNQSAVVFGAPFKSSAEPPIISEPFTCISAAA